MMTAGRSLSAAGRSILFQIGLIICFSLWVYLFKPEASKSSIQKQLEFEKTRSIVMLTLGAISLINLSFVGMELLNAGKCIQRHWKYFGIEH